MTDATSGLCQDRIFLSNYVRELDIGCYAEEHGVLQRVRFDITLDVEQSHKYDAQTSVISYDTLFNAIDQIIEGPRLNLLETFAEQLAIACLDDQRAKRVHIRIEKLDRLGGAGLGVEITRGTLGI